jgi:hypothetical protein
MIFPSALHEVYKRIVNGRRMDPGMKRTYEKRARRLPSHFPYNVIVAMQNRHIDGILSVNDLNSGLTDEIL